MPPYACAGFLLFFAHKFLHLSRIPTLHMQILMLVQVPNNLNNSLHQGSLPTIPTLPYTGLHTNPKACTGFPQFSQFLRLVQAFDASHANPYACEGSFQFQNSLTPVWAPKASYANPYACTGSQQFKQFLMPGQAPDNSNTSLNM
ncbi:hypothetical protein O181_016499 [Austropuccinia psidii MF-1]|uniref:Uncharacterized protein n=1 Tax=Austropuccinia psidii MF-1 TaxID=1389203 RepID=A0A9Q3GRW1_9BASI|nr:hypothetical protein [Austropuccinia psidii MF-1]